jgi:hypothetical protein
MTYGVVRAFQVIVNTLESSPEKAGVGGSTPSLATIILKNLPRIRRLETGKVTHGRSPTLTGSVERFPRLGPLLRSSLLEPPCACPCAVRINLEQD